jgi:hypothetical protein
MRAVGKLIGKFLKEKTNGHDVFHRNSEMKKLFQRSESEMLEYYTKNCTSAANSLFNRKNSQSIQNGHKHHEEIKFVSGGSKFVNTGVRKSTALYPNKLVVVAEVLLEWFEQFDQTGNILQCTKLLELRFENSHNKAIFLTSNFNNDSHEVKLNTEEISRVNNRSHENVYLDKKTIIHNNDCLKACDYGVSAKLSKDMLWCASNCKDLLTLLRYSIKKDSVSGKNVLESLQKESLGECFERGDIVILLRSSITYYSGMQYKSINYSNVYSGKNGKKYIKIFFEKTDVLVPPSVTDTELKNKMEDAISEIRRNISQKTQIKSIKTRN